MGPGFPAGPRGPGGPRIWYTVNNQVENLTSWALDATAGNVVSDSNNNSRGSGLSIVSVRSRLSGFSPLSRRSGGTGRASLAAGTAVALLVAPLMTTSEESGEGGNGIGRAGGVGVLVHQTRPGIGRDLLKNSFNRRK